MLQYKTSGTCSSAIAFDVKDHKLTSVQFTGGCNGNLKGIAKLVEGMDIDEVITRLDGVQCGYKPTSCPDQLSRALKAYKEQYETK